jgi:hypothetical protein
MAGLRESRVGTGGASGWHGDGADDRDSERDADQPARRRYGRRHARLVAGYPGTRRIGDRRVDHPRRRDR